MYWVTGCVPAHGLAIPGGRLRAGPVYRAMLFLAVLLSVRSRPAWLARAVRPCPCDVPLPAAQPPSQHGAVVAWDRDQAGGRRVTGCVPARPTERCRERCRHQMWLSFCGS